MIDPNPLGALHVVGTSWRRVGIDALTRFTLPEEVRAERLAELVRDLGSSELVYVATCNRVEVAFREADRGAADPATAEQHRHLVFRALTGIEPRSGEVDRAFCSWLGDDAVEHVFLLAAGLDSAQVGERDVQGQLRHALAVAHEMGLGGPLLDEVFGEAIRQARLIHQRTRVGSGRLSLAEIGLDYLRARLRRTPGPVALVGVSTMTRRCALALVQEGVPVVIANRTLAKAEALAVEVGGVARSLDQLRHAPDPVEAILLATSSTQPVLDGADLERLAGCAPSGEAPLVVDMAVPPDIDPGTARALGMVRIGMAEITAEAEACRDQRLEEAAPARALVLEAVASLRRRRAERLLGPVIARLGERYQQTALDGLERLLQSELKGVSEAEREALRRFASMLGRRLAHLPTVGLKALAADAGAPAVTAFLAADPDLLREYHEATDPGAGAADGRGLHMVEPVEARRG